MLLNTYVQREGIRHVNYVFDTVSTNQLAPMWEAHLFLNGANLGTGLGSNKKRAMEEAARQALSVLQAQHH
jgi:dsRNA-specific ribonuclease